MTYPEILCCGKSISIVDLSKRGYGGGESKTDLKSPSPLAWRSAEHIHPNRHGYSSISLRPLTTAAVSYSRPKSIAGDTHARKRDTTRRGRELLLFLNEQPVWRASITPRFQSLSRNRKADLVNLARRRIPELLLLTSESQQTRKADDLKL